MELSQVALLLACGLGAGFVAGLFGIGGGVVLVPAFWLLFKSMGVEEELSFKLSVATSLGVIALTTLFTSGSHLLRGSLKKNEALKLLIWVVPGVAVGVFLASFLPGSALKRLFGLLLIFLGMKNLTSKGNTRREKRLGAEGFLIPVTSFLSGLLSALLGIGGGVVVNSSLFTFSSLPVEKVVAYASVISFLNASLGALLYLLLPAKKLLSGQVGFIYVPGALLVSASSVAGSRLGLRALRLISQSHLKKSFAVFMIILGIKVLLK